MLRVLERDYKQSFDSAVKEFRYCRLLIRRDDKNREGYLLAVNDDPSTENDFDNYVGTQCEKGELCLLGYYREEVDDCVDY